MTRRGLIQSFLFALGLGTSTVVQAAERLSYEASCRRLLQLGLLDGPNVPPMPDHLPHYDDAVSGVSFFRQDLEKTDLSDLSLPRTFFGRSETREVSFRNTDLSQSNLCWNTFIRTDFSGGSLEGGDLRSSLFARCSFQQCDLRGADLRRASFEDCDFSGARLDGAIATLGQPFSGALTDAQAAVIDWRSDEGPEPDGG